MLYVCPKRVRFRKRYGGIHLKLACYQIFSKQAIKIIIQKVLSDAWSTFRKVTMKRMPLSAHHGAGEGGFYAAVALC